jgi:hypothetical protein
MNINLQKIKDTVANFLRRFHIVIFTVIVAGGLVFVMLTLNNIVAQSSAINDETALTKDNATFDTATIKRIEDLNAIDEPYSPVESYRGRKNPFTE